MFYHSVTLQNTVSLMSTTVRILHFWFAACKVNGGTAVSLFFGPVENFITFDFFVSEEQNILHSITFFFFENRVVCEIMCKNVVESESSQMTI